MGFFANILKKLFICVLIIFVCCEYVIYNVVIYQCSWPHITDGESIYRYGKDIDITHTLRAIILSDPHLLGPQNGHWFDKLRREWQMKRSFQSAMTIFKPEAVFVLGDIFDEGMICSDEVSLLFQHPVGMKASYLASRVIGLAEMKFAVCVYDTELPRKMRLYGPTAVNKQK